MQRLNYYAQLPNVFNKMSEIEVEMRKSPLHVSLGSRGTIALKLSL